MIEFYLDDNGMYHYFNTDTNIINNSCMIHTMSEVVQLAINEPVREQIKKYDSSYYTVPNKTSLTNLNLIDINTLLHSCLKSDLPTLHLHYPELFI